MFILEGWILVIGKRMASAEAKYRSMKRRVHHEAKK